MTDELQSAADYDDRTSTAVRSVLVEIGQTLDSFRGKFAVIGGAVPWLLLKDSEMRHVGTLDIDLSEFVPVTFHGAAQSAVRQGSAGLA